MKMKRNDRFILSALWIVLGVMARFLPHPPNVSPMNSISIFGGANLSRSSAFFVTFSAMILSDILISSVSGHAAFGWWTLFTYSGFAAMIFAGGFLQKNFTALRAGCTIAGSSLGFWIWTNFGIWVTQDHQMYPRTMEGLMACYASALPFLANSMAGDLVWGSVFFLSFAAVKKLAPRLGWNVQNA